MSAERQQQDQSRSRKQPPLQSAGNNNQPQNEKNKNRCAKIPGTGSKRLFSPIRGQNSCDLNSLVLRETIPYKKLNDFRFFIQYPLTFSAISVRDQKGYTLPYTLAPIVSIFFI